MKSRETKNKLAKKGQNKIPKTGIGEKIIEIIKTVILKGVQIPEEKKEVPIETAIDKTATEILKTDYETEEKNHKAKMGIIEDKLQVTEKTALDVQGTETEMQT